MIDLISFAILVVFCAWAIHRLCRHVETMASLRANAMASLPPSDERDELAQELLEAYDDVEAYLALPPELAKR
ncbi:MAG TPA: hypothetical protein VM869_35760 [Enhygromyxa sp.]|jgi:hypothetical protein|nr:hypothetical protein [Enhygromyxa sp.]